MAKKIMGQLYSSPKDFKWLYFWRPEDKRVKPIEASKVKSILCEIVAHGNHVPMFIGGGGADYLRDEQEIDALFELEAYDYNSIVILPKSDHEFVLREITGIVPEDMRDIEDNYWCRISPKTRYSEENFDIFILVDKRYLE